MPRGRMQHIVALLRGKRKQYLIIGFIPPNLSNWVSEWVNDWLSD